MARRIDRFVIRGVLVLTALAGLAAFHNHKTHPCTGEQVGAGGMCVSTSWTGGAR